MMKTKSVLSSIMAGIVSAMLSYGALISPANLAAIAIRRKMPDAWFSGLITWYAMFVVGGISLVVAALAFRMVYKRTMSSTPRS